MQVKDQLKSSAATVSRSETCGRPSTFYVTKDPGAASVETCRTGKAVLGLRGEFLLIYLLIYRASCKNVLMEH